MPNYAYAARKTASYPADTSWNNGNDPTNPNPFPWNWNPPEVVPKVPKPNQPGDVDFDIFGESYRFSHIVKSLNQRLVATGQAASTLSTTDPDRLVTYTLINTARNYVEGLYDDFVDSDGDAYANYNAVLVDADPTGVIFGFADADNGATWTSFDSDGITIDVKSDMESDDVFTSFLMFQLEIALQELVYITDEYTMVVATTSYANSRDGLNHDFTGSYVLNDANWQAANDYYKYDVDGANETWVYHSWTGTEWKVSLSLCGTGGGCYTCRNNNGGSTTESDPTGSYNDYVDSCFGGGDTAFTAVVTSSSGGLQTYTEDVYLGTWPSTIAL